MCNEIDFKVIFQYIVALQWTMFNTIEMFIVVIWLLYYWTKLMLLCCDFALFISCIDT
jgi:hypothetical protein